MSYRESSTHCLSSFVLDMLRVGDTEAMRAQSLRAFHSPRLDYICLQRSPQLTVKLYRISGGNGWLVAPHNHRYAFQTFLLLGRMENVVFAEKMVPRKERRYHLFHYRTPLVGGSAVFEYQHPVGLEVRYRQYLQPGLAYTLTPDQVHTISVPVDSLLLLIQHADEETEHTRLYMHSAMPPSLEGLYKPFDRWQFADAVGAVREALADTLSLGRKPAQVESVSMVLG